MAPTNNRTEVEDETTAGCRGPCKCPHGTQMLIPGSLAAFAWICSANVLGTCVLVSSVDTTSGKEQGIGLLSFQDVDSQEADEDEIGICEPYNKETDHLVDGKLKTAMIFGAIATCLGLFAMITTTCLPACMALDRWTIGILSNAFVACALFQSFPLIIFSSDMCTLYGTECRFNSGILTLFAAVCLWFGSAVTVKTLPDYNVREIYDEEDDDQTVPIEMEAMAP